MTSSTLTSRDNLTLVVVRTSGRNYRAKRVAIGGDVSERLREIVHGTLQRILDGTGRRYDPDDEQGDADFLEVPEEELLDTDLLRAIEPGSSLEPLTDEDGWNNRLYCYAVMVEDDDAQRTILLRKASPVHLANKRLVTRLLGNHLDRIDSPIFAFDDDFDVVIRYGVVRALHQQRFERLFKSSPVVLRKLDDWTSTAFAQLPIAPSALAAFKERATKNSRTLRKLQSIACKPHVRSLTLEQFKAAAIANRLDVGVLIRDGQINLCSETEGDILALLNDDVFEGTLSGDLYLVSRKAVRQPPQPG